MIEHPEAERVDPIAGDVHAVRRDSRERYGARKIKCVLASWRPLWGVVTFCWTSLSVWSLVSVPDGFRRRARAGCVCP